MNFLGRVVGWFTASEHWQGPDGVPNRLWEHVQISGTAVLIAIAIALPIGLALGHTGKGGVLAVNVSNIGRAVPSFAVLVFTVQLTGIGTTPAVVALIALAVPPILTNTYVAMREVDPEVREAAHGMGMTGMQQLRRIEAPLALPLIMAGVRTSAVQVVATATLAAIVASGGLGRFIVDGFASRVPEQIFAGGVLVAGLAIAVEVVLGLVEGRVAPGRAARSQRRMDANPSLASPALADVVAGVGVGRVR